MMCRYGRRSGRVGSGECPNGVRRRRAVGRLDCDGLAGLPQPRLRACPDPRARPRRGPRARIRTQRERAGPGQPDHRGARALLPRLRRPGRRGRRGGRQRRRRRGDALLRPDHPRHGTRGTATRVRAADRRVTGGRAREPCREGGRPGRRLRGAGADRADRGPRRDLTPAAGGDARRTARDRPPRPHRRGQCRRRTRTGPPSHRGPRAAQTRLHRGRGGVTGRRGALPRLPGRLPRRRTPGAGRTGHAGRDDDAGRRRPDGGSHARPVRGPE